MKFGVPNQRPARKPELFPTTPVLTIGIDGGKGTSRAMILNRTAVDTLKLEENNATVAFGFDEDKVYITNGNQPDIPDEHKIRVTKGNPRKISEKKTYTYISTKIFQLDNSIENHFELEKVEDENSVNVFELKLIDTATDNVVSEEKSAVLGEDETFVTSDNFTEQEENRE